MTCGPCHANRPISRLVYSGGIAVGIRRTFSKKLVSNTKDFVRGLIAAAAPEGALSDPLLR